MTTGILDKSNWNTKRNQLREENAKLVSERDNLQTSYDEMKILNANLTQNISRLENEKDIFNAVKLNLTKEIDELKKQIGEWKYYCFSFNQLKTINSDTFMVK